jgi:Zinc finger, C3HC4 type (RING finger)
VFITDRQRGLSQLSPRRTAQLQGSYDTIHHMLAQHLEGSKSRIQQQLSCVRTKCATPLCVWLMATIFMCWFLRWNKRYRERQRPAHGMRCPICFSLLYRPVTLLCGHTACESCCAAWFHQSDLPVEERVCFSGCGARHGCPEIFPASVVLILDNVCCCSGTCFPLLHLY